MSQSARPASGDAACHAIRHDAVTSDGRVTPNATPAGYGPVNLQLAYKLGSAAASAGMGQTVAIVDAYDDPKAESDLGIYRSQYGLAPCTTVNGCFRKVNQSGGTKYPRANGGWAQEISLDLDMVSAVCPNCLLLVEASSSSLINLGAAVNEAATLGATVISNSYGGSESASDTSCYHHPGVAITVSSGDGGYGVEYPAAPPYVTAVGGTTLAHASTPAGGDTSYDTSCYHHPGVAITVSSGDGGYGVEYPAASPYVTAVGGICKAVLTARHGAQLRERDHWAQTVATATAQLGVWEKIQADNPDYGAHGSAVARLVAQSFPHRGTPARRAYRDYLTTLPAPAVYPEREPNPAGAAILTDLAHPQLRQQRQQRLQDNLNTLRTYQHQRTPPPVSTRTTPRTTGLAPSRTTPPPTINRYQDRGRGYGR